MDFIDLTESETVLKGNWVEIDGKVFPDDTCRRIESLVGNRLEKVGVDSSGWDVLFRDPHDGRLWEQTFPESHLHGGGPPTLKVLSMAEAQAKYGVSASPTG